MTNYEENRRWVEIRRRKEDRWWYDDCKLFSIDNLLIWENVILFSCRSGYHTAVTSWRAALTGSYVRYGGRWWCKMMHNNVMLLDWREVLWGQFSLKAWWAERVAVEYFVNCEGVTKSWALSNPCLLPLAFSVIVASSCILRTSPVAIASFLGFSSITVACFVGSTSLLAGQISIFIECFEIPPCQQSYHLLLEYV